MKQDSFQNFVSDKNFFIYFYRTDDHWKLVREILWTIAKNLIWKFKKQNLQSEIHKSTHEIVFLIPDGMADWTAWGMQSNRAIQLFLTENSPFMCLGLEPLFQKLWNMGAYRRQQAGKWGDFHTLCHCYFSIIFHNLWQPWKLVGSGWRLRSSGSWPYLFRVYLRIHVSSAVCVGQAW